MIHTQLFRYYVHMYKGYSGSLFTVIGNEMSA